MVACDARVLGAMLHDEAARSRLVVQEQPAMPRGDERRRSLEQYVARARSPLLDALVRPKGGVQLGFRAHQLIISKRRDPAGVDVVWDLHGRAPVQRVTVRFD